MKGGIFLAALLLLSSFCFGEQTFVDKEINLAETLATDIAVIGGMVTCQPVRTSYGYIATGDGKQLYGFTQEGRLLWQRNTRFRLKKFLSVFSEDLVCIVSTDNRISLLNSSGLNLWTQKMEFNVVDAPVQGIDGRIFVRGSKEVACLGIKGTQRWIRNTAEQNQKIKPLILNDGSIVVLLSKTKDGKTVGTRISPFGKMLEDIVFAGTVLEAETMQEGAVLTFTDGSAGLLSVENKMAISKWTIPSGADGMTTPLRILPDRRNSQVYFVYGPHSAVARVKTKNGEILSEFYSNIGGTDFQYANVTTQGLTLCTKERGLCMDGDGNIKWKVKFDPKKSTKFMFTSDSGYVVLCNSNWSMELYQARLNVGSKGTSYYEPKARPADFVPLKDVYPSSYDFGRLIEDEELQEIRNAFLTGQLDNEEDYLALINLEIKELCSQWNSKRSTGLRENIFFRENVAYAADLLSIASSTQVYFCRSEIISMIKNVNDPSLLVFLIKCAGEAAWDPDCQILDTIDQMMNSKKITPKDTILLNAICDATWEICRFMGRPSFFSKGRHILSNLLYPQFPKEIRDKAVETMKKIADADL